MLEVRESSHPSKSSEKSAVNAYGRFKKARMAHIKGNFMGGGFQLSQNKVKAVLDNIDELAKFANGEYDEAIDRLEDDQVLAIVED